MQTKEVQKVFYAFWVLLTMVIEHILVWKYDMASTQMNWFGVAFMIGMICVAIAFMVSDFLRRPMGRTRPAMDGKRSGIRMISPFFMGSFITFTYGLVFSFIYY
jgi:hypothetical protein